MQKRGQFYLIAAFVVIGLIVGVTTVYNKVVIKEEDPIIYDLSDEINFEAGAVIDSGIYNEINTGQINDYLRELLEFYASTNPDNELVVLFGDRENMTLIVYNTTSTGSINLDIGTGAPIERSGSVVYNFRPVGNSVRIVLGENVTYEFTIKPGQSFFLILKKTSEDETFVAASESFSPECGGLNQACCGEGPICNEGLRCESDHCIG